MAKKKHKHSAARIKTWLLMGRAITPLIALNNFRCFRLSSVIHRLRKKGYNIDTHIVKPGSDSSYARYTLVKIKRS